MDDDVRSFERWNQMSPHKRRWFSNLSDADLDSIDRLIGVEKATSILGRVLRYGGLAIASALGFIALVNRSHVGALIKWLKGSGLE
jgi:hypothetical protein